MDLPFGAVGYLGDIVVDVVEPFEQLVELRVAGGAHGRGEPDAVAENRRALRLRQPRPERLRGSARHALRVTVNVSGNGDRAALPPALPARRRDEVLSVPGPDCEDGLVEHLREALGPVVEPAIGAAARAARVGDGRPLAVPTHHDANEVAFLLLGASALRLGNALETLREEVTFDSLDHAGRADPANVQGLGRAGHGPSLSVAQGLTPAAHARGCRSCVREASSFALISSTVPRVSFKYSR